MGQITANAYSDTTEYYCKKNASHETLPQHFSRSSKVVGTDSMCHLNVETYAYCMTHAAEKPNAGADKADARTGCSTKTTYHAGIDVLHHDVH